MIKRVLFIGLGSAGQRHLRNILKLLGDDIEIIAYRYHKSERVFDSDMKIIANETLTDTYGIREFDSYEKALDAKPDIVIIANPNNMHVSYAIQAAQKGIDIFIEKPLAVNLERTEELEETIHKKDVVCQVGFQQRYHPCIKLIKSYLETEKLGEIVSVNVEVGERISKMHCYEDYQDMLESHRKLGGGVVLCQVHELDYIFWLFGMPDSVYSVGGKRSTFDIDVEDAATTIFRYKKENNEFAVVLHQDFLQYPPVRKCKIIGTKGRIEVDLLNACFCYQGYEESKAVNKIFDGFDRNEMFMAEMRDFFECVEARNRPKCDAEEALMSTKIGLAIKKSFEEKREVKINECEHI